MTLFAQANLPSNTIILTQKNFIGRPYYTVAEALNETGFIDIQTIGYVGTQALPKMRGLSGPEQVVVLIDGQSINHTFDGQVDLNQIPLNMVERIEISRGGGSVGLGTQGTAGVINIITIRPTQKGLVSQVGTDVGRDGVKHSQGQFTGRSYWGDITYTAGLMESNGYLTNEDHKTKNHFFNYSRSFNGKGYGGLEYYFQDSQIGLSQGTFVPFPDWDAHLERISADGFAMKKEENQHAKIFLASPKLKEGMFYLTLSHQMRDSDLYLQPGGPSQFDEDNRTWQADLKWKRKGMEAGIERMGMKRNIAGLPENKVNQDGMYVFNKWIHQGWTILPGLRASQHSEAGNAIDPRIALIYSPWEWLSLSGTAQTAHRYPNFNELFYSSTATANPDLNAEKARMTDIGLTWTPGPTFTLSGTHFQTRVKDRVLPDTSNEFQNSGEEKTQGIETRLTMELGPETKWLRIRLNGNWTYQKSRLNGLLPPLTPQKMGTVNFEYALPRKVTITNELHYQGEQYEFADKRGLRIPSYYTWNLRFGFKILSADLYFQTNNVTRRRYADTITQSRLAPQAERTFLGGITIRFLN